MAAPHAMPQTDKMHSHKKQIPLKSNGKSMLYNILPHFLVFCFAFVKLYDYLCCC